MRILNKRRDCVHGEAVLVDRTTVFGNPFIIGRDGTRHQVVEKHRVWLNAAVRRDPRFAARIRGLAGKDLTCWCAPLGCHAENLARMALVLRKGDAL